MPAPSIKYFSREYHFLSNFHACSVPFDGIEYPSAENAYQAQKESDPKKRIFYRGLSPGRAKQFGKTAKLRPDWPLIQISVMREILRVKFLRNPKLGQMLIETGDAELIETNYWGDRFWGVDGTGENHLGKLLMQVREELQNASKASEAT